MHRLPALLLLVVAFPVAALAQSSSKAVVSVDAAGPSTPVAAGTTFDATVTLHIKAGYHVNAQKPSEDYLIGTMLETKPPAGVTVAKTSYPSTKYEKFSFSEKPLAVYEGTAVIKVTFKVDASAPAGSTAIPGKVTFQSCNDQQCLPPATVDVSIPVEIGAAASTSAALTLTGAPPDATVSVDGRAVGKVSASGRFESKDLKPGNHKVRIEHDGFEPWEQSVTLAADVPKIVPVSAVAATTEAAPAPAPVAAETPAPAATPAPPAAVAPPEPETRSNAPLVVGGGIALALAALGVFAMTRRSRAR